MSSRSLPALLLIALAIGTACYTPPRPPRRTESSEALVTTTRRTRDLDQPRVAAETSTARDAGAAVSASAGALPVVAAAPVTDPFAVARGGDEARPARATAATGAPLVVDGRMVQSVAFPSGEPTTSALLLETSLPSEIVVGQPFTYEIVVRNLTERVLSNLVVTDAPTAAFERLDAVPPPTEAGGRMRWEIDRLGARASRTIAITGRATAPGALGSCAQVTMTSQVCSSAQVVQPGLAIVLRAPAEVIACDPIPLEVVVTNTGSGTVRDLVVTGELPGGLDAPDGDRRVRLELPALAAGESRTLGVTLRAAGAGRYPIAAAAVADGGLAASAAPVTVVARQPVLAITKTGRDVQYIGRELAFDITVTNSGDGAATDTVVRDTVPAGASFVRASDGGRLEDGAVTWTLGTLGAGESRALSVVLRADGAGAMRGTATVSAACAQQAAADAATDVRGISAILLEVVDLSDPVGVGEDETYLITVTNQGSAPDTNVVIAANAPAQVTPLEATGPTVGTIAGSAITFAPLPRLGAGEEVEYRITVRAGAPGDVRFAVRMTSDQLSSPVQETEATNLY